LDIISVLFVCRGRSVVGAAKLFRTAAEYYNHGASQNYLAVLYNAGAGLEQDDLAALYWFDRAADNGVEVWQTARERILGIKHGKSKLSPVERELQKFSPGVVKSIRMGYNVTG